MKKSLLLIFTAGCWIFANAQTASNVKPVAVRSIGHHNIHSASETGIGSTAYHPLPKNTHKAKNYHNMMSVNTIKCGSCYNIYGLLDQACSQADVNPDLGLITFTHREDASKTDGTGTYEVSWSKDGGNTWDSNVIIFPAGSTGYRYPNGAILNPKGNLKDSLAYVVVAGPHTNGATTWDTSAFGSVQLSGASGQNINQQTYGMYPGFGTSFACYSPQTYLQVCEDSTAHTICNAISLNASSQEDAFYGAWIWDGTWSSGSKMVTWKQSVLRPKFMSYYGNTAPSDSGAEVDDEILYAWSQDGSIGYIVFFGNLDSTGASYASLQPVVYKTTNHGATWAMMPVHNFANDPVLTQYLRPVLDSSGSVKLPFWDINGDAIHAGHGVDATVDMNGNLHIFGVIESGAVAAPDSGGYTFNQPSISTMYIYDVYTKTSGGWGATFIDSLLAPFGVETSQTPWTYDGGSLWGARIQATRSKDGSKIFCTWTDDEFGISGGDSTPVYPVIYSVGINVATNMMTAPTFFSTGALYDGADYFMQVSGMSYSTSCTGGNFWNIPCVILTNQGSGVNSGDLPVNLVYIQGMGFCDDQFSIPLGVNEIADANGKAPFSVSANYPNPFTKQTSFDVTLTDASAVTVDVFNMVGQKVASVNEGTMTPGKHMISLDGSSLSAGVYFYKVTANGYAITNKMIVE